MSDGLKPCPFCGCMTARLSAITVCTTLLFWVSCPICYASTAREVCEYDAAAAWNRRANNDAAD